jgi:hypothetical protein
MTTAMSAAARISGQNLRLVDLPVGTPEGCGFVVSSGM